MGFFVASTMLVGTVGGVVPGGPATPMGSAGAARPSRHLHPDHLLDAHELFRSVLPLSPRPRRPRSRRVGGRPVRIPPSVPRRDGRRRSICPRGHRDDVAGRLHTCKQRHPTSCGSRKRMVEGQDRPSRVLIGILACRRYWSLAPILRAVLRRRRPAGDHVADEFPQAVLFDDDFSRTVLQFTAPFPTRIDADFLERNEYLSCSSRPISFGTGR